MNDGITDELTGLPNKRFAVDYVGRELARARRNNGKLAVALLDMNGFKRINDVGGHAAGDRALAHVAAVVWRARCGRRICAHATAATNFSSSCPGAGLRMRKRRIEQIQDDIIVSGRDAQFPSELSVSAGIAMFPDDGTTFEALFAAADARMYSSKLARATRIG